MLTHETAIELIEALRDQMGRCPGCHGVGRVLPFGEVDSRFCLVCEEAAKCLYLCDRDYQNGWGIDLSNAKVFKTVAPLIERTAVAAREFAKRCPGCYGIRTVWAGGRKQYCLVCARLHAAIDAYETNTAVQPELAPTPIMTEYMTNWEDE